MPKVRSALFIHLLRLVFALWCGVWFSGLAHAEERRFREHEFREHEFRQREFMDSRHHHDHYYPPRGYVFGVLPREHHVVVFGGAQYFFGAGIWYRRHNEHFIVVAPPFGVVVPVLPPAYATVWVGRVPYYYANNVYYVRGDSGYIVTQPPPADIIVEQAPGNNAPPSNGVIELGPANAVAPPPPPIATATGPTPQFFIYPRQGQNQELQNKDRSECHSWAVGQIGSDPTSAPAGQTNAKLPDYGRALGACLDGRGYTVK